jgi:hypothetical protein
MNSSRFEGPSQYRDEDSSRNELQIKRQRQRPSKVVPHKVRSSGAKSEQGLKVLRHTILISRAKTRSL